jgi:hypothetical protein
MQELYAHDKIRGFSVFTERFEYDGQPMYQCTLSYNGTNIHTTRMRLKYENCLRDAELYIAEYWKEGDLCK